MPLPSHKAFRTVDLELPSGEKIENIPLRDIGFYIMLIENGREDFLILNSHDGFLQFYGINNQFVAEIRINLPGGGFRTFSFINKDNMHLTERMELTTPYGWYMPTIREIVSLELVKTVIQIYYENINTEDFLKAVPIIETTKEHKRSMGLMIDNYLFCRKGEFMYQTYKPSGKVSMVFFPLLVIFLFLFIPSVSFIFVFAAWYCPSIILDGVLYLITVFLIALFGNRVCIRIGKVRNLILAGLSGVLAGITFFYMLPACSNLLAAGTPSPKKLFQLMCEPQGIYQGWNALIEKGLSITTVKGTHLFTLRGGFFIGAAVILLLLTIIVLALIYVDASWIPFCEASGKWAASRTIYLEYIENKELFIKKAAFGDMSLLEELDVLKGINCSHSEAELYFSPEQADYYITIDNKKKKEEKGKDGEVKFEDETLLELQKLDSRTGEIMMSKVSLAPEQASAAVITYESGSKKMLTIIRMVFAACIQIGLLVLCFNQSDGTQDFFSNGLVSFYMLITVITHSLSLLGCLVKEDVMVKNEEQLYFDETKRYQVERRSSPLIFKIYYGLMLLTSILILTFCIRS